MPQPGEEEENKDGKAVGAGPSPAEGASVSREEFDQLMGRVTATEEENKGLRDDLRAERAKRRNAVRSDVAAFTEKLSLSADEKKKIEEGLAGEDPVPFIIDLAQRVLHYEYGKMVTHQTAVSDLIKSHPDMFDEKTGRYLPDSPKGKLWEQIAQQHPEYAKSPNGVRLALDDLSDLLDQHPEIAKGKKKLAKAEEGEEGTEGEEGEEKGAEGEEESPRPHVGTGGRKPAPKKPTGKGLTKDEEKVAARYGGSEAYQKSKGSKVIEADV